MNNILTHSAYRKVICASVMFFLSTQLIFAHALNRATLPLQHGISWRGSSSQYLGDGSCAGSEHLNFEGYGYRLYANSCTTWELYNLLVGGEANKISQILQIIAEPETVPGAFIDAFEEIDDGEISKCAKIAHGCRFTYVWLLGFVDISAQDAPPPPDKTTLSAYSGEPEQLIKIYNPYESFKNGIDVHFGSTEVQYIPNNTEHSATVRVPYHRPGTVPVTVDYYNEFQGGKVEMAVHDFTYKKFGTDDGSIIPSQGPENTKVTIKAPKGVNFLNYHTLCLGGEWISFWKTIDKNTIKATIPVVFGNRPPLAINLTKAAHASCFGTTLPIFFKFSRTLDKTIASRMWARVGEPIKLTNQAFTFNGKEKISFGDRIAPITSITDHGHSVTVRVPTLPVGAKVRITVDGINGPNGPQTEQVSGKGNPDDLSFGWFHVLCCGTRITPDHHALNPHVCPYGDICVAHPDADDANTINLYWNNSYFDNFKEVDLKVNGKFIKGGGRDFNHIAYHLEPGKVNNSMLTWTLSSLGQGSIGDYYINSETFSFTAPKIWDSFASYKKGDKAQYQGKVYCARENYQGHGDPNFIKSSLWRKCSLL